MLNQQKEKDMGVKLYVFNSGNLKSTKEKFLFIWALANLLMSLYLIF